MKFLQVIVFTVITTVLISFSQPSNYHTRSFAWSDSIRQADSLAALKKKNEITPQAKLEPARHSFNHRQQIILSAGMMAFMALVLSSAQMWNPE